MDQGRTLKSACLLGLLILSAVLFQGCLNVATTGAQAIYNHRSLQNNFSDQYITLQINNEIEVDKKHFHDTHISAATYHGYVLLAGQVPTSKQRVMIENIVKDISGVKHVYNFLQISWPNSMLTRMSDTWITAKVKGKLIASNDLDVNEVKVITENGTVYLMGTLQKDEAEAAVSLASETTGVESVVKIFSYLQIVPKFTYLPPTLPNASQ